MSKPVKNSPDHNKARGRRDGSPAQSKPAQRERNIGHSKGEEHSIKPKSGSNRRPN